MAKDVQAVSESTQAVEQDTRSFIKETQPLVVETLKDKDQLTRSSQELAEILCNLYGTWLEPADGNKDEALKQNESSQLEEKYY